MPTQLYTVFYIFALAVLAYAQDLQTVISGAPEDQNRNDPERGIFVAIEHYEDESPNSFSSSSSSSTEIVDGIPYSITVITDDTRRRTFRIRLTEETLRYLITNRDEHSYLRFLAVRDLPESKLDLESKKKLMKLAIKEPEALVRSMAAKSIPNIKPTGEVASLLIELLNDPCIDVAANVVSPLIDHYKLKSEYGEELDVLKGFNKGPPWWFYMRHHQDILRVALALQAKDNELISPEAIAAIRSREIPSDEWFLAQGTRAANLTEARKHFIEKCHQESEQVGVDQPASSLKSKSEGNQKIQPEAEESSR